MTDVLLKLYIKEKCKDLYYKYRLRTIDSYNYYYVHPTKTGGTFLKNILLNSSLNVYANRHELKVNHIPSNKSVIISIRDPIKRFESSFYSLLHKRKNFQSKRKDHTENWKKFYSLYPDINSYINALRTCKKNTLENSYTLNDHLGRFSNYSYWLKSSNYIKRLDKSRIFLLRTESLNDDIELFFREKKLKLSQKKFSKHSNTYKKIIPIDKSNINFLKSYLTDEYHIVNTLLDLKNLPPYRY